MTDTVSIASLGVEINATTADDARALLDKLTAAGARTEAAMEALAAESRNAMGGLQGVGAASTQAAAGSSALTGAQQVLAEATRASAEASHMAAVASNGLVAGWRETTSSAVLLNSAAREMAEAIREVEQADRAAAQAAKTVDAALTESGQAAQRAAASYEQFYEAAQRDFSVHYTQQLSAVSAAHAKAAKTAGLATHEMSNFGRQLADVGVQGAMGVSPFMILIQQGPQIADVFATAAARGVTFKAALASIVAEMAPFALFAGIVAAIAAPFVIGALAAKAYGDQVKAAEAATMGLGKAAGLTADQLMHLADASADAGKVSVQEARKGAEAYVSAGIASQDVISGLVKLQRQYAFATGQDAAAANAELAKSFAHLTTGVDTLDGRLNFLDGHTKEHILTLARQVDQTDAQKEALIRLATELDETTKHLKKMEGGWDGVKRAALGYFDALGQLVNPGLDEKIRQAENTYKQMQAMYGDKGRMTIQQKGIVDGLKAEKAAGEEAARQLAARGAANDASKAAIDNYKALNPLIAQRTEIEQKLTKARADAKAGLITQAQLDQSELSAKQQLAALDRRAAGPQDHSAENRAARLQREADAQEAVIAGNYDLAAAYRVSDAEAMKTIATTKATADALTKQGDIQAFIDRQIRQSVSEQAVAGAKSLRDIEADTKAKKAAYAQVAAGQITMAQAQQQLKDEAALRQLVAAEALAEGDAKATLSKIIEDLKTAQAGANEVEREAAQLAMLAGQADQLEYLRTEALLIGASNRERAIALAQLKAEQDLRAGGYDPAHASDAEKARHDQIVAGAMDAAAATYDLQKAQDAYNDSLERGAQYMEDLDQRARDASSSIADAFSGAGDSLQRLVKGIGGLMNAYSAFAALQARIDAERQKRAADIGDSITELADFETKAYLQTSQARIQTYGDMAAAGRTFFKEGSDGYKLMTELEIAFRAVQLLGTIKAMAGATTETAAVVTQSGIRTAAKGVEAYVGTLASLPFPFNIAAGAVVLAALASVGVALRGGGGGASVSVSQRRQDEQGAGSVLGDAKAKSDSIAKSLELVAAHTNDMLGFYNPMLRALRSIDNQIGTFAAAVARSLGAGGMLDTSSLGLGSKTTTGSLAGGLVGAGLGGIGGSLLGTAVGGMTGGALGAALGSILPGIGNILGGLIGSALFSQKVKTTLKDQGLQFMAGTLGSIIAGGLSGSAYADLVIKTSNQFAGVQVSSSTKKKTVTTPFDADFQRQADLLIASLRSGVLSAASVLGIEGAQATLDAFKLDLGKISLKGLTGDEIEKAIEAVFSKAADQMASAVFPGLNAFQKVGEGLFETLTRLATDYQTVDISLKSIGMTFGQVGVASIAARERLIDLFGSLDNFTDATSFYAENFLTEAERLAPIQDAVNTELARLGLTGIKTRDQFKQVVQGLDVSTTAGAELFAALMNLAPAFAAVTEETQAVTDAKSALSAAYDRESDALKKTRDDLRDLADSLHKYGAGLYSGPAAALSPEEQYRAAQAEFQRVSGLARAGDQTALGDLQDVSQAYLDASKAYFASSEGYFQDLAAVRDAVTAAEGIAGQQADVAQQQLDALTQQVGQLIELNTHVVTVAEAIQTLNLLLGGSGSATTPAAAAISSASNDNSAVVAQLQQSNDTLQKLVDTQRASIEQQAAIQAQQQRDMADMREQLAKLNRTAQA